MEECHEGAARHTLFIRTGQCVSAITPVMKTDLAESDEALGGGQVLILDAHACVLSGEAQEAPDTEHECDVQPGDTEAGQRLPYDAPLHPLQYCHHPATPRPSSLILCMLDPTCRKQVLRQQAQ